MPNTRRENRTYPQTSVKTQRGGSFSKDERHHAHVIGTFPPRVNLTREEVESGASRIATKAIFAWVHEIHTRCTTTSTPT